LIYFEARLTLHEMKRLTTSEVAERLGVAQVTVNVWCLQGKFSQATREDTPRGPVWTIPESDLTNFVRPTAGRPPKPKPEQSNGKKRGKK
jgi:hypothetical protein